MGKKIYKELNARETPIFSEVSHNHLTTYDMSDNRLKHYYDAPGKFRLLESSKVTNSQLNSNLEDVARIQFNAFHKQTNYEFDTDMYAEIFDVKRQLKDYRRIEDKQDEYRGLVEYKKEMLGAVEGYITYENTIEIKGFEINKIPFYCFCLGLLELDKNKALKWFSWANYYGHECAPKIIDKIKNELSEHLLRLDSVEYFADTEGYFHPMKADGKIDLDAELSIRVDRNIIADVMYNLSATDEKELLGWISTFRIKL